MPQFKFQFETLLEHRKAVEDAAQRDLATVLRKRMILQDQLRQMQETITASKRQLAGALVGKVDLTRIGQFATYSGQVSQRARQFVSKLAQAENEVLAARAALTEAMRARKAMELLRERHRKQWQRTQDRRETAMLDEIALQQHVRKQTGVRA